MQSNTRLKQLLVVVGVLITILFLVVVFSPVFDLLNLSIYSKHASLQSAQLAGVSSGSIQDASLLEQERPLLPTRLRIPKIGVDAVVQFVGLTSDWAMDVPSGPDDVAWFELGRRPGEEGTAVISGHYGWKNNIPAVFDNLHNLRKGDNIYIEDERGDIISFVVRESRRYDPKADASDVFGSSDGKAHLNLITCEGVWDKTSKTYSKRLVVFADKE